MGIEIGPGRDWPRGATWDGAGVNFAVHSRVATRFEVCLFDSREPARETARFELPACTAFTWHGYVPELEPGTLYGLRVHGPWQPARGQRCNPHKLLVDPYAKALSGSVQWDPAVLGYTPGPHGADLVMDARDSAPFVPRAVVVDPHFDWRGDRPLETPWSKTVIYELHVRGFSKLQPAIPEPLRGTYAGLAHPAAIEHLVKLGVTAVELLPVHEFVDDAFLLARGLSNYWGYSTLGFFAPALRYANHTRPGAVVGEFKAMVRALHQAGIEVILDVVYNHTCEGNQLGPTLSLKGIDNEHYYTLAKDRRHYRDVTGCGNSLNVSEPATTQLIVDSLRYWASELHVDGFRFDLATTLGRDRSGTFQADAPLFQILAQDPLLSRLKLIAEPWDLGHEGYRVGEFCAPLREWNDKYRDAIRRLWLGRDHAASQLGERLRGSHDVYSPQQRGPYASINFITCHDGFTLHDLVSYERKHNLANGENDRDGSSHNHSANHGVEGETDRLAVVRRRERQKRNLLATLLLSQGVPMITAGDELGRSQRGNNNAYCQDNELSWLDWNLDARQQRLLAFTRRLLRFRRRHPVLQQLETTTTWFHPDGSELRRDRTAEPFPRAFAVLLHTCAPAGPDAPITDAVLALFNAQRKRVRFALPKPDTGGAWTLALRTHKLLHDEQDEHSTCSVGSRSLAVFTQVPASSSASQLRVVPQVSVSRRRSR